MSRYRQCHQTLRDVDEWRGRRNQIEALGVNLSDPLEYSFSPSSSALLVPIPLSLYSPLYLVFIHTLAMSLIRNTALRASALSRVSVARRYASAAAVTLPKETQEALDTMKLNDPRIASGTQAYYWPAPPISELPKTEFLKRRLAVAEHSEGESSLAALL